MSNPELPPLLPCTRDPERVGWPPVTVFIESVEARERIMLARIAELEARLLVACEALANEVEWRELAEAERDYFKAFVDNARGAQP